MTTREQAIEAIGNLPEDADLTTIIRELAFIAGIEEAREEIDAGRGLSGDEAKALLRECLSS